MRGIHIHRCIAVLGAALIACAQSSNVAITASTAPIGGSAGAEEIVAGRAAVETITKGYDRFIVLDGQHEAEPRVVGYDPMPISASTRLTIIWDRHRR